MIRFDRIEPATYPSRPSDPMDFKKKRLKVRFGRTESLKNAKKKLKDRNSFG
jgi:hypothetical protein